MKYMKIEDLEPGDIIKFKSSRIQLWNPRLCSQVKLYTSVFKKIYDYDDGFYQLCIYFVDGNNEFIEEWAICIDTELEIPFDILHLV